MKATATEQHDRITLKITDDEGRRLNLTWNRRGERISARAGVIDRDAMKLIARAMGPTGKETIGDRVATMKGVAEEAGNFGEFAEGLQGAKQ